MSLCLESGETLSYGLQRMVLEQFDTCLRHLEDPEKNTGNTVHDTRKRLKKVRAVLRMVRVENSRELFRKENACLRDAGRNLAEIRDSAVRIQTLDRLVRHAGDRLSENPFAEIRSYFEEMHRLTVRRFCENSRILPDTADVIREAKTRVRSWADVPDRFSAVGEGMRRVYRKGKAALETAYRDPMDDHFHEWRKRAKYLWYHTRILRPLWPGLMKSLAEEIHTLTECLGEDHDLAVLHGFVNDADRSTPSVKQNLLFELIRQRQQEIRAAARPLGERIYAETPADFTDRIYAYWNIWRNKAE